MLSVGKAARLLGVTPATARRWTEIGLLPCTRTAGGHRRIARDDVVELARAIGGSAHMTVRQARERELETLVEASIAVTAQLEQGALLAEIAKYVTLICRCHTCSISSYDVDTRVGTILAEYDARGRRTSATGTFDLRHYPETLRMMEEQVPGVLNFDDPRIDAAERALLRRYGDMSVLEIPLVYRGRTVGLLEAIDRRQSRSYSRQEMRIVNALAGQAAVSLRNAELYEAATRSDTAMTALQNGLATIAAHLDGSHRPADRAAALPALATALCAGYGALSVVIALDGAAIGAATDPAPIRSDDKHGDSTAHVLTSAVDGGDGRLEITVVIPKAPRAGQAELLDVAASFASLLL
jgi:excisionase family DNA binding protein